jgi:hypothetical protein
MTAISGHGLMAILLFLSVLYVLMASTRPLAVEIPSDYGTLRELAQSLHRMNYGKLYEGGNSDTEVWDILCSIVSEQLGAEKDALKPETNFVNDLNLD